MSHVDDGTLTAMVDGEVDALERATLEAHLASCGDCARRFAEATALARQVTSLLTTLDVSAPPRRAVPRPDAAPVPQPVTRRASVTWRRVAVAASVLLVAGVSYEVGRRDDGPAAPAATIESAPVVAMRDTGADVVDAAPAVSSAVAAPPVARSASAPARTAPQAAVSSASPMIASPPAPPPSANAAVVEKLSAPNSDARRAMVAEAPKAAAEARRAADAPAGFAAATGAGDALQTLPGYTSRDIAGDDALRRTQFVATDGATLVLLVTPESATRAAPTMTTESAAFTVATVGGRSTVTWASRGRTFELRGTLAPDSLLKLAALLR